MKSPQFLFYLGYDPKIIESLEIACQDIFKDVEKLDVPGLSVFAPQGFLERMVAQNERLVCAISGWIRSDNLPLVDFQLSTTIQAHLLQAAKVIFVQWPVTTSDISGNYSGLLFNRANRTLFLFSDPGSIYPMYYARCSYGWLGGTHLITLNRVLKSDIDLTGIVEQLSPPHFACYGRRTVVRSVNRVLPGELIKCSSAATETQHVYDNTFFNPVDNKNVVELAELVWSEYKNAVRVCVGETEHVNLGLSGGWDSRLVAASLKNKQIRCFTYGVEEDEYEVRLARRISSLLSGDFRFYDFSCEWAPSKERFIRNLLATEATYVTEWLALLSQFDSFVYEPFLLGDMFETVAGRHLHRMSSRHGRKQLYWQRILGNTSLPIAQNRDFDVWRRSQLATALAYANFVIKNIDKALLPNNAFAKIGDELVSDFDELLKRVKSHNLIYLDTFDELLTWYLRGISGIGRQILTLNEKFFGFAPTMSFRAVRLVSGIYPFLRVSGILMSQIQKIREISPFARLPSANAPFIPSNAPLWISDLIWAGRSSIDQLLVKLALKQRNVRARVRVVKTINYAQLYNLSDAHDKIKTWFSGKIIKPDAYLAAFQDRSHMIRRPLGSWDITGPANASLMADLFGYNE